MKKTDVHIDRFFKQLEDDLIRDEGLKTEPYMDCCSKHWRACKCHPKGKLTIGVGRNLDDTHISRTEATLMLRNDINRAILGASSIVGHQTWTSLSLNRRRALTNMCFNLGTSRFGLFHHMLEAIRKFDYQTAASEILDSLWAKQVGDRATRIADIIKHG